MISFLVILALAVAPLDASVFNASLTRSGCSVSVRRDLREPQPLVLVRRGLRADFVNPVDAVGTLRFSAGEEFRLACPGSGNFLVGVGSNVQDIAAFCVSGTTFRVNSRNIQFSSLVCNTRPLSVVRRTGSRCLGRFTQVEIGFALSNEFMRTIEICRDDVTFVTYFTRVRLTRTIAGFQSGYERPSWRQEANFWGRFNLNTQYARSVQRATVSTILGSTALGNQYISNTGDLFFSRGHLVARGYFIYGMAQWSTFWYLNSAPQWQSFNGGNWNDLENDVRSFASARRLDLEIYTGTHGITTLRDANNVERPIHFYASGSTRALPVPLFFWKIIYDPITRRGTAFVGVNNPYIRSLTSNYFICRDISNTISWLTWRANNIVRGISYACTVADLRRAIPTIPAFTVVGNLV